VIGCALLLSACRGVRLSFLPEALPSKVLRIEDGGHARITMRPVRLTIDGTEQQMYGYNGQIPGPRIDVTQGSTVTIDVTNNIDVESTIHWHGLRLENANDGVPKLTQDPIQPGKTFRYELTFPDEGIYWYHPHVQTYNRTWGFTAILS